MCSNDIGVEGGTYGLFVCKQPLGGNNRSEGVSHRRKDLHLFIERQISFPSRRKLFCRYNGKKHLLCVGKRQQYRVDGFLTNKNMRIAIPTTIDFPARGMVQITEFPIASRRPMKRAILTWICLQKSVTKNNEAGGALTPVRI